MQNGWIKYYANGTNYFGTDKAVSEKLASWRRSNNENIVKVELIHEDKKLSILGIGNFWQSDMCESVLMGTSKRLLKRRIEKQIDSHDKYFRVSNVDNKVVSIAFNNNLENSKYIPILSKHHGCWLILELDLVNQSISYFIKDKKI